MRKILTACMALTLVAVLGGCGAKDDKKGIDIKVGDKEIKVETK